MFHYGTLYIGIKQRVHLQFTLVLQARACLRQIHITNAGMQHDFGLPIRKCVNQVTQGWRAKAAGRRQAQEILGRAKAILARHCAEFQGDGSGRGGSDELRNWCKASPGVAEPLKGHAYARDAGLLRHPSNCSEHSRMRVRVLMRIEMRGRDAGALDFFNLGAQFPFDIGSADPPGAHTHN